VGVNARASAESMQSHTMDLRGYALSRLGRYARYWGNVANARADSQPLLHLMSQIQPQNDAYAPAVSMRFTRDVIATTVR
jgi:hypothetical protein